MENGIIIIIVIIIIDRSRCRRDVPQDNKFSRGFILIFIIILLHIFERRRCNNKDLWLLITRNKISGCFTSLLIYVRFATKL